jgi:AcrR family transcriptional regulator
VTLRERKRQAAREHVAEAATPLFVRDGYRATTTRKVAAAAGVAEGTVFNLFGSKAGLLLVALQRAVPDTPRVDVWADQASGMSRPEEVIDLFCRTDAEVADRALPLVRVFVEAASVDAEVAAAWRDQEEHRLESQRWLLHALAAGEWLRTDRDEDDLARDLWVVAAPETYLKCRDAGMAPADVQRWKAGLLRVLLLRP